MKQLFKLIMGGMLMLAMPLMLTSCEGMLDDIFGEWSRPTGGTSTSTEKTASISFAKSTELKHFGDGNFTNDLTNTGDGTVTYTSSNTAVATVNPTTGEVTPIDVGTATITATVTESGEYTYEKKTAQYELGVGVSILKWDETLKALKAEDVTTGVTLTGTIDPATITAGTYIIYGNATISGNVEPTDAVNLILLDGSKLQINGYINVPSSAPATAALSIYAQSEGDDKGQLTVTTDTYNAITCYKGMNIHGSKITAETTGGLDCYGFFVSNDMRIYGGHVSATGSDSNSSAGYGICANLGNLLITGKAIVEATGGTSSSSTPGAAGIAGNVTISGQASLTATGGDSGLVGGHGIDGNLTISGEAKFTAIGGKSSYPIDKYWSGIFGTLTNECSASVTFETSSDGTSWDGTYTLTNVSPGNSGSVSTCRIRKL